MSGAKRKPLHTGRISENVTSYESMMSQTLVHPTFRAALI
jgi:hypothetical protein